MNRFSLKSAFGGGGNSVNPSDDEALGCYGHSEGNNVFMSEESQNREDFTIDAMFRAKALNMTNVAYKHSRHTEEQHLQSAECWLKTQAVCKTFQPNEDTFNVAIGKRKYPITSSKELLCKKDNYIEINNQLDCFGSKEPHNDDVNSVILSDSERSHKRADFASNAILRELNNCSPQNDRKNSCRLTRGDVGKPKCKAAFTLAETLITLGIIGVIAALTLPTVINKCQSYVLKQQFKKAYATMSNAVVQAQSNLGGNVACGYWLEGDKCQIVCKKYDDTSSHNCIEHKCADNTDIPQNVQGVWDDCVAFNKELFKKVLKSNKYCATNALANGCITSDYRGVDKVYMEQHPDVSSFESSNAFSDRYMKNWNPVLILQDGTLIMKYATLDVSTPIYLVDINGHKGPNKWGYDIFTFILKQKTDDYGVKKLVPITYATDKGGKTGLEMLRQ